MVADDFVLSETRYQEIHTAIKEVLSHFPGSRRLARFQIRRRCNEVYADLNVSHEEKEAYNKRASHEQIEESRVKIEEMRRARAGL